MAQAFVLVIGLIASAAGAAAFVTAWCVHGRNRYNIHIPIMIAAAGLFCFAVGIPMLRVFARLLQVE